MSSCLSTSDPVMLTSSTRCQTHPQQEVAFYCVECENVVCSDCVVEDHVGHKFTRISPAATAIRNDILETLMDIKTTKIPNIQISVKRHMADRQKFVSEYTKMREKALSRFAKLKSVVEELQEDFACTFDQLFTLEVSELDDSKHTYETVLNVLTEHVQQYESYVEKACDIAIIRDKTHLENNVLLLKSTPVDQTVICTENFPRLLDKDKITAVNVKHILGITGGFDWENSTCLREPMLISNFGFSRTGVTSIAITKRRRALYCCAETCQYIRHIELSDTSVSVRNLHRFNKKVVGMTSDLSGNAYFILEDSFKIKVLKSGKKSVSKFCNLKPLSPTGIAVDTCNLLLVTAKEKKADDTEAVLLKLSVRGKTLQVVNLSSMGAPSDFIPTQIATNFRSDIFLMDKHKSNTILAFDSLLHLSKFLDGQQENDDFRATSICCDKEGRLIVSDTKNGQIMRYNENWENSRFPLAKINQPTCLTSDDKGRIWIGTIDSQIALVNLPD